MPASEDKPISEFPIASSLTNRALALLSAPDGQGGYDSVHAELNEIGRTILETDYTQDIDTVDKSVFGAINELNGINTYSTIEKAIGKWTDNKTIYRKVLTDNFGNSMSLNIDIGVEIDTLVYISIKVIKGNIVFELPFRNEISASEYYQGYSFVNLQTSGNNALVTIIGSSSNSTYFNNCDVQVIMEYTKRS